MMDKLTPLERELMRSVSALQDGFRQDMSALRDGLKAYENGSSEVLEDRLTTIESAQSYLDQRLATIEDHQLAMLQRMNDISQICAEQMGAYASRIEALSKALERYKS